MSENRRSAPTGAVRDNRIGKGRFDLIPPEAMLSLARTLEEGALKYSDRNWEKGMPVSWCLDSLKRHITQWELGMDDEDHLGHALFNLSAMITTISRVHAGLLPPTLLDGTPLAPPPAESVLTVTSVDKSTGTVELILTTPCSGTP